MCAFQSEKMKVKAWWIMHLIIFVLMTLGCWACSEPPQCVPGRVLACPCPANGQGIQRCAEDGSRFLDCECGHVEPPISSLDDKQSHLNMGHEVQKSTSLTVLDFPKLLPQAYPYVYLPKHQYIKDRV